MRRKLYVMFVFCVLVSSAMGLSIPGEPQEVKLPSRNTKPKKILTASASDVMAKLFSGGTSNLSEKMGRIGGTHSAANSFTSTGKVFVIVMGENGIGWDGFKSSGIRNTGTTPWKNVTATIKADISHVQGRAQIGLRMYKDGRSTGIRESKGFRTKGSISITTPPFTIEPGSDWHALVYFTCYSESSNDLRSVIGTIREISFDMGK